MGCVARCRISHAPDECSLSKRPTVEKSSLLYTLLCDCLERFSSALGLRTCSVDVRVSRAARRCRAACDRVTLHPMIVGRASCPIRSKQLKIVHYFIRVVSLSCSAAQGRRSCTYCPSWDAAILRRLLKNRMAGHAYQDDSARMSWACRIALSSAAEDSTGARLRLPSFSASNACRQGELLSDAASSPRACTGDDPGTDLLASLDQQEIRTNSIR
ncbi:unnamed protein product [Nesidiocoris tenuis]|uniref:Uncharacterized protein n=1 Tax=Nesidiocoris tenuis TaxID=355587 RepID=A0A6H5GJH7_9HEMI|nr:unnamed protein product [Nesidiocoris tenuis]